MVNNDYATAIEDEFNEYMNMRNYIKSDNQFVAAVPSDNYSTATVIQSSDLTIARLNQLEELVHDLSYDCKELLERLQPQTKHVDTDSNTDESNILNGMEGVL